MFVSNNYGQLKREMSEHDAESEKVSTIRDTIPWRSVERKCNGWRDLLEKESDEREAR